jgi:hypothetical protein
MKGESLLGALSTRLDEIKKPEEKKRGRGRRPGWRKNQSTLANQTPSTSGAAAAAAAAIEMSNKKPMLL